VGLGLMSLPFQRSAVENLTWETTKVILIFQVN